MNRETLLTFKQGLGPLDQIDRLAYYAALGEYCEKEIIDGDKRESVNVESGSYLALTKGERECIKQAFSTDREPKNYEVH